MAPGVVDGVPVTVADAPKPAEVMAVTRNV